MISAFVCFFSVSNQTCVNAISSRQYLKAVLMFYGSHYCDLGQYVLAQDLQKRCCFYFSFTLLNRKYTVIPFTIGILSRTVSFILLLFFWRFWFLYRLLNRFLSLRFYSVHIQLFIPFDFPFRNFVFFFFFLLIWRSYDTEIDTFAHSSHKQRKQTDDDVSGSLHSPNQANNCLITHARACERAHTYIYTHAHTHYACTDQRTYLDTDIY